MALSTKGDYLAVVAEIPEENEVFQTLLLYDTNSAEELLRYKNVEGLLKYKNNKWIGVEFSTKDELILYSDSEINFYTIDQFYAEISNLQ